VGITSAKSGNDTSGKIPPEIEKALIDEGFDIDGTVNGEVLLLIVKGEDYGF
jgi:hypothetical protein